MAAGIWVLYVWGGMVVDTGMMLQLVHGIDLMTKTVVSNLK